MDRNQTRTGRLNRAVKWAGGALAIAAVVYFVIAAKDQWQAVPTVLLNASGYLTLALAVLLYLVAIVIGGFAWHILLCEAGERSTAAISISIWLLTQVGKYIPGNVAQYLGRVALARATGYSEARTIYSTVLETGWAIVAAASLGSLVLIMSGQGALEQTTLRIAPWQVAVGGAGLLVLSGFAIRCLVSGRIPFRQSVEPFTAIQTARWSAQLFCFALYIAIFMIWGAMLDLLALRLFDANRSEYLSLTGIFAVAWVAGYVTPGAPAGLGIREAVLVATLTGMYGGEAAVGLTIALRLVTTAGDAAAFVGGVLLRRLAQKRT